MQRSLDKCNAERTVDINVSADLPMRVDIKIFALSPVSWDLPCTHNCTTVMWADPGVLPTTTLPPLKILVVIIRSEWNAS